MIGEELDRSGAQGAVTINFDFSNSMALDSNEGQRKIADSAVRGMRQLGLDAERLRSRG